jgi:hypothetical protein
VFFNRKIKKVKLTEGQLRERVLNSMYVLSDGLEWHIEGQDVRHPVVMASPEEIADSVVSAVFWSPSGKNSSASTS